MSLPYENATSGAGAIADMQKTLAKFGCSRFGTMTDAASVPRTRGDEPWQRWIGYGVPAYCDHPDCNTEIDRGLSYVCGNEPYGGEHGCGLYFCASHQCTGRQQCAGPIILVRILVVLTRGRGRQPQVVEKWCARRDSNSRPLGS